MGCKCAVKKQTRFPAYCVECLLKRGSYLFVKGVKRTTSLTRSQFCLLLAQLVCCRRYLCGELLSNENDTIRKDYYVLLKEVVHLQHGVLN